MYLLLVFPVKFPCILIRLQTASTLQCALHHFTLVIYFRAGGAFVAFFFLVLEVVASTSSGCFSGLRHALWAETTRRKRRRREDQKGKSCRQGEFQMSFPTDKKSPYLLYRYIYLHYKLIPTHLHIIYNVEKTPLLFLHSILLPFISPLKVNTLTTVLTGDFQKPEHLK